MEQTPKRRVVKKPKDDGAKADVANPQKPKPKLKEKPKREAPVANLDKEDVQAPPKEDKGKEMSLAEKLELMEAEDTARRKKRRKKILIRLGIGLLICAILGTGFYFLLTGNNDKRVVSMKKEIINLNETIVNKDQEIANLHKAVEDTTVKEVIPITSLQRVEGSVVPELRLIDGDFIAPNPLNIPTSQEDVNDTKVQIGSQFSVVPSEGWLMNSQGTTVEFGHGTKVWGKIRAVTHRDRVERDSRRQIIQNFFVGYPATTISYRDLFFEETLAGAMGSAEVTVKDTQPGPPNEDGTPGESVVTEKQMVINVGFAQRGENTINFLFVHEKTNTVGQELVDSLLRTGQMGTSKMKVE